ncbi:MAG: YqgE/AlgH family protein [Gammaproteobacteria bacterium]|nr:YqgE/AlgH family protein [Gammaproteobacteria bacterium]
MEAFSHHFLLATPALAGTWFGESIIYLCRHDAEGAMGLVINREARMNARGLARSMGMSPPPDALAITILEGGPVAPGKGFILHSDDRLYETTERPAPGIALSTSRDALAAAFSLDGPRHSGIYLGYAGWGAGQLDAELEAGAWLTAPANRSLLFECSLEQRLTQTAQSIGVDLRLVATRVGHA